MSHSTVASPGFGARRGTKLRENNLRDVTKFVVVNSDKTDSVLLYKQPHDVERQSLCGSEVTQKIKHLEVEGVCPIAGDANVSQSCAVFHDLQVDLSELCIYKLQRLSVRHLAATVIIVYCTRYMDMLIVL